MKKNLLKRVTTSGFLAGLFLLGYSPFSQAQDPCDGLHTSSNLTEIACDSFTAQDGQVLDASGIYTITIPNAAGCDSVITLDLTINASSETMMEAYGCDSYTSGSGATYMSSGVYIENLTNMAGCDSTVILNVTVISGLALSLTETACDSYTSLGNTVYNSSGNYVEMVPGIQGCAMDVTLTLDLTINASTSHSMVTSACETYTAPDGMVYTTTGTYMAVIPNAMGCDSTITIDLTIHTNTSSSIVETACETYTAPDGMVYTTSGIYTAVIPNAMSCDSTITIDLTIGVPTSSTITDSVCQFYIAPDGVLYNTSGNYVAVIPNALGCDSTIAINLTILNNASSSTVDISACVFYMAPDSTIYTVSGTFVSVIPNAFGCDSTITTNLTINQPTPGTATVQGTSLIASPSDLDYQWIDCNTMLPLSSATNQIVQPVNGSYAVIVINEFGCADTSNCVNMVSAGLNEGSLSEMTLAPNPVQDLLTISLSTLESAVFVLSDLHGKVIERGIISKQATLDMSSLEQGIYLINLETEHGKLTERIIKL